MNQLTVWIVVAASLLLACDGLPHGREQSSDRDSTSGRPDAGLTDAGLTDARLIDDAQLVEDEQVPGDDLGLLADQGPACTHHTSSATDYAPVQTVGPKLAGGKLLPAGYATLAWAKPTAAADYTVAFAGSPGAKASHEGVDYVIGQSGPATVPVRAAADGFVVYLRLGCPQSCMFCHNTSVRECGAGWGNHAVLLHAGGIFTRYAHLAPGSVPATLQVGAKVTKGQQLALMGNSGRSETRHLHLELGTRKVAFDPCATSQSFDLVFDPAQLPW